MKKWTKVLSAFVVATVMSAGMAAAVGCDGCGEEEHKHTYKTEWVPGTNGHWHESDCGHDNSATEPHVDEINNDTKEATPDGLCDVCGYQMQVPTPPAEEKVTVSFVTGEGATTVAEQKIDKGGKATEPTAPTKPDHTFGGWFIDADCTEGNEFDFDTAISADLPLYAKWTANGENPPVVDPPVDEKVTVTFVTGEGATTVAEQKIDKGGKATEPTAPTKADHTFGGWFTDAACTEGNEFDFDTEINADLPLYAKWTANGENPPVVDPPADETVYEQLVKQTGKHIVNENFDELTAVKPFEEYGTAGVYQTNTKTTEAGKDSCNVTVVEGKAVLNDASNDNGTALIVDFGSTIAATGTVEGYFETTVTTVGSGWTFIQFGRNGSERLGLRSEKADSKNIIKVRKGGSSGTVEAGLTTIEVTENTTYKIYFKIVTDSEGSKISVKIGVGDGEMADFCEYTSTTGQINSIKIVSSDNKSATQTIDNIIVIGDKMTVDDYRTAAQAEIDAAYVKMVGKAAVGTEGEEGYVPAVVGTHSRNAAAIQSAYAVIDLSVISEITEIKTKVAEFTALSASVESDAKITAAIAKYSADLADVKTNQAANYTVNKTAFDALIAKYEAVDFSTAKTVATVTAKYAQFEVELAAILTDAQETAKALLEAKTAAKATVNGTTAPNGASQSVIDRIEELKAAALEDIEGAATEAELQAIMTEFATDVESATRLDNLPLYQAGEVTNLKNYAKAITDTLDAEKDATLISAINGAVGDGETAINAAQDTAGVDAAKIAAETAVDKLVAKDTLAKYAATKKAAIESKGEYAAITAIKDAIDGFVTSGSTAIDASAVKDDDHNYVNGALEAAKANIDTEFEKVNSVKFTITISGVENVTAEQVAYGQKAVVDTSRLADNVMVKGWYTDAAKHNAFDFNTAIYDDITLYAETVEAVKLSDDQKFVWVKQETDGTEWADGTAFEKDKSLPGVTFLTVGDTSSVIYYGSAKVDDGKNYVVINKGGYLNVKFKGAGTLKITLRGTSKTNEAKIYLQKSENENWTATGATNTYDDNIYGVVGQNHVTVTFKVDKAGTYKLGVVADSPSTARVSVIEKTDSWKVEKIEATGVEITNGENATIAEVNETLQLKATVTPANSTSSLTWTSSDETVATVDENGLVTAKAKGLVTITVTIDGHTDSIMIDVANFAQYVQDIVSQITNYDGSGVAASNADRFAKAKTDAIAELVDNGVPVATTAVAVAKVFEDFEAKVLSYANVSYTITLKNGDVVLGTEDVNENETLSEASLQIDKYLKAVAGKKLVGWYTDAAFANSFDFATAITADDELFAKYEAAVVKIDGVEQTLTSEGKVTIPETPTDPDGRTFLGWFEANASEAFDFTNTVVYRDYTLTAKWKAAKHPWIFTSESTSENSVPITGCDGLIDITANGTKFNNKSVSATVDGTAVTKAIVTNGGGKTITVKSNATEGNIKVIMFMCITNSGGTEGKTGSVTVTGAVNEAENKTYSFAPAGKEVTIQTIEFTLEAGKTASLATAGYAAIFKIVVEEL